MGHDYSIIQKIDNQKIEIKDFSFKPKLDQFQCIPNQIIIFEEFKKRVPFYVKGLEIFSSLCAISQIGVKKELQLDIQNGMFEIKICQLVWINQINFGQGSVNCLIAGAKLLATECHKTIKYTNRADYLLSSTVKQRGIKEQEVNCFLSQLKQIAINYQNIKELPLKSFHGDPKRNYRFWQYQKGNEILKLKNKWDFIGDPMAYCTNHDKIGAIEYQCKGHDIGDTPNMSHHGHPSRNYRFWIYPKNKTLPNQEWDFYSIPCSNYKYEKAIFESQIYQFICLGHSK